MIPGSIKNGEAEKFFLTSMPILYMLKLLILLIITGIVGTFLSMAKSRG